MVVRFPTTHPFLLMPEKRYDASMLATVMTVASRAKRVAVEPPIDALPNSSMTLLDPS